MSKIKLNSEEFNSIDENLKTSGGYDLASKIFTRKIFKFFPEENWLTPEDGQFIESKDGMALLGFYAYKKNYSPSEEPRIEIRLMVPSSDRFNIDYSKLAEHYSKYRYINTQPRQTKITSKIDVDLVKLTKRILDSFLPQINWVRNRYLKQEIEERESKEEMLKIIQPILENKEKSGELDLLENQDFISIENQDFYVSVERNNYENYKTTLIGCKKKTEKLIEIISKLD